MPKGKNKERTDDTPERESGAREHAGALPGCGRRRGWSDGHYDLWLLTTELLLRLAGSLCEKRIIELLVDCSRSIGLGELCIVDHLQQRLGLFRIQAVIELAVWNGFFDYRD